MYRGKEEKWGLDPSKYYEVEENIDPEEPAEPVPPRQIIVDMTSRFKRLEESNFDITFAMSS